MNTEIHEVFFLFKTILINYVPATAYMFIEKKLKMYLYPSLLRIAFVRIFLIKYVLICFPGTSPYCLKFFIKIISEYKNFSLLLLYIQRCKRYGMV